ncbi:hypothetical protein [Mesorhizobium sp. LjNodule214]|uniref:hypothetical protein n=1 Tax=Mesorhizobium sp. LjNodule214 TaxID=3342252 RepID=UPI003ED0CA4C
MKRALSALFVVLALSQTVEAKTAPVAAATAPTTEESRPPLDNTPTGGITPAGTKAPATDGSQYPPALYLNFQ